MARIVVLGGGVCGSTTAMLLARDGHDVTILEKESAELPASFDDAWESWTRKGVAQFRQAHYVHARFRHVLDAELPDVRDALDAAGGLRFSPLLAMPPFIEDREPRPDDDRFETLTGRRPVLEYAFARAVADEPGVNVARGVSAIGLVTGAEVLPGVPHVTGVRTADGEEITADLVVDATGRRSELPDWIVAAGGRRPIEEPEDSGFTYYTRYFRGELPAVLTGLLTELGSISLLTLPADNNTWSVTVYTVSGDQPLKRLRDPEVWMNVVAAHPFHAHWLSGEPITDVLPMSGIVDRYRRFVVDGMTVATGVAAVGDAWACTNPSLGRGLSLGLWQATILRDVVREHLDDPKALADVYDATTESNLTAWYRTQVQMDRERRAQIEAIRENRDVPVSDDPESSVRRAIFTAMLYDPDIFRSFLEIVSCLTPAEEVFSRPDLIERALAVADGKEPVEMPAPSREELLALVS